MRKVTGTLILSATLLAAAGAAQAGNEGSYTLMPVQTQTIGANYVAPEPSFLPQPTEIYVQPVETMSEPMATETMSTESESGQVSSYTINSKGEIIFHDAPKSN